MSPAPEGELACLARLVIQAGNPPRPGQRSASALPHWLRNWHGRLPMRGAPIADLAIEDRLGHRLLLFRGAQPPLEIFLPAGTYHVNLDTNGLRRRYTVKLEADSSFELRVCAFVDP